ncbi:glyoxylate reductase [Caloramator quimbayensis]|uniref:Glyoxylate reductase n=1 Tax=Caloramator quimbayensis TaxID=1147123 RepID=A0A1T4X291_9CLOT|nr:D-glycerate dehydrogenase [Caloramator quimbayensis]SKA83692.1 glyoxylate reductase [Caloramator quimbayensis]
MNVFVTRVMSKESIEYLKQYFNVKINEKEKTLSKEELLENVSDCDAIMCLLTDIIDKDIIKKAGRTKIIANCAVGYNNIDVEEAKKHGIVVTNTPDVLTDTTADLAFSLILGVSRRIVEADSYTRAGLFKEWGPTLFLGQDVANKTLGIIGAGRIGKAVAKRAIGFNMKILYTKRNRDETFENDTSAKFVDLDTLLKESDFISIHVPLNKGTYHLIGERELSLMKKSAILINTSRGPVVDEEALAYALKSRRIWGAGLDVFEKEPEINKELIKLSNVILLPHIGSATIETRGKMAMMAAQNIVEVLNGRAPINPV